MVEILKQYMHHHPDVDLRNKIQSFLEKTALDIDFLMGYGDQSLLWSRLIYAAHKAEDLIEIHIIKNQFLPPTDINVDSQLHHLTDIVREFESILEQISELVFDLKPYVLPVDHVTSNTVPWYPKLDPRSRDDLTCIFEYDFQILKRQLIEEDPFKLRIISIIGMWGMGKRTLARRLLNDPSVAAHFRTRAWVTSPYVVSEKGCLLNLLEGLGMLTNELRQKKVNELEIYIRNALKRIKYFIVIHDVIEKENLVTFTKLFRDYRVGSRIMFTTSSDKLDEPFLSGFTELYYMHVLTDTESWLLFRHKVFGREPFPHELEHIGINIMQLCTGDPQVLSLVAGVLATSEKTSAVWELVATTLDQLEVVDGWGLQLILFMLIYNHLPHYLRPCLLYTGAFYEPRDIKASKIIKLWIAEGFVKQSLGECVEDVANTYLQILIDKNLLDCTSQEPNGRVKAFQTQISLRQNYWVIACAEKFLGSKYLHEITRLHEARIARRVSVHGLSEPCDEMELPMLARSLLSVSDATRPKVSTYFKLRLLRVLEVFQLEFYQFPVEIMQQVLLRYLSFSCHSNLSNSFSVLHYLQTLIIRRLPSFRAFSLPSDLWGLTQLRHVKCKETFVMIYPENGKEAVHENLQTLSNMQLNGVTNHFLKQIPNIRNLGIFCNTAMESTFDLACLEKLETLKCSSDWSLASRNFLAYLTLPQSLRKLNLCLCRIPWKFMKVIGSLPNLELLKLQKSDFVGASSSQSAPEWATAEGEFPRLLSLEMLDLNLVHWKTKATHLPELKHLVIRNCYAMMEIPSNIGNIGALELIEVNESSPGAMVSAMQIKKEQEGRGNTILQVRTHRVVYINFSKNCISTYRKRTEEPHSSCVEVQYQEMNNEATSLEEIREELEIVCDQVY